ncbi:hypothetical protein SUGI_0483240 [Cryptomeria japonica]|uniref:C2 and GRAM domain-containing protein At1g03370 n=1 Tax=Cryptomeria japonica TaxID=3369 RepID=UPI002408BBDC|nr:C2 and GRAM domain-containing protein At1g03370 [Cryptomeria japonica]GLJ25245.1 hypothetical protein SUGI_0483240 [Cryptomeria japonica]
MKLQVQVLEARGLPSGVSEAFVRLQVGHTKAKTRNANAASFPWYEDFYFKVDDLKSEVVVTVQGDHGFGGHVRVPIALVFNADKQVVAPSWFALNSRTRKSKTFLSGEICMGLSLYGRSYSNSESNLNTPSSSNGIDESVSISTISEPELAASTPNVPVHSRISSSESLLSSDNDAVPGKESSSSGKKGRIHRHFVNHLTSLFSKRSRSVAKSTRTSPVKSVVSSMPSETSDNSEDEKDLIPSSFFKEDPKGDPRDDIMIAPLAGGILVDQSYAVTAGRLNAILFMSGSQFVQDLAIVQNTTDLLEGPWKKLENELPHRTVTYMKAPTKMIGCVKAIEEQMYLRADKGALLVKSIVSTPDVPFGTNFQIEIQFCIRPGPIISSGEETAHLFISWSINFLRGTMMKSIIVNAAQQGLNDSYKQYVDVLANYARCIDEPTSTASEEEEQPQSDWELAKGYFVNFPVLACIISLAIVLLHIYFPWTKINKVLGFFYLDLPDSLEEFITSAILAMQLEHVVKQIQTFLQARVCRGSDHGVKAQGEGWLLTVTLVCGENLSPLDETGTRDPYVVFTCNGKTRTSSVKLNTLNPEWHEVLEFDATEDAPSTMDIEVFDFEGPFSEAESLGHAEINFLKQSSEDLADLWVQLEGKYTQLQGSKLHLRICLINTKDSDHVNHYIQKVEKEAGKKILRRSPQKNLSFQRLFSLPPEEFLINDFACALKRKIHLQGRLFLSPRMLGFYSNIFGHKTKFLILWDDIDEVQETSPGLSSVGLLLNPSILVFTKKGRGKDACQYAKSLDSRGRCKFQFQSFVHFGPAYRIVSAIWRSRTLSFEQQMEIIADADSDFVTEEKQADDTETFIGLEEANMSEVYSEKLPVTVESLVSLYDKENLDEKIMNKMGCLNYMVTPWEQVGDNPRVTQRQQFYKLNHRFCHFDNQVTRIQQRNLSDDAQVCAIAELITLQAIPYGDHFQVHVRREVENISVDPPTSDCKIYLGIAWQKSTLAHEKITKNCKKCFTKYLEEEIELSIKELIAYKNNHLP